ncbi:ciliary microtubule inner protein 2B-like [Corticium candelabrum]|uniref:ciliary microtubule inner protein 2B-like n=1 Tax=Corticium candelabrum TaxID=121492 RepID=UPI002E26241E|nr:ciliary microtubule inner protein 2B-like [Corticium candelabrum]
MAAEVQRSKRYLPGALDGAYVPGYLGYRPQLKFYYGKTYGSLTRQLAKRQNDWTTKIVQACPDKHVRFDGGVLPDLKKRMAVPPWSGGAKFARNMVSSYSGFIPGLNFTYGSTFQEAAKDAIQDHIDAQTKVEAAGTDLQQTVHKQIPLTPQQSETAPYICNKRPKDSVKHFRIDLPPIPGYMGWVPRYAHCGLGKTHDLRAKEALEVFNKEQEIYNNRDSNVKITELKKLQDTPDCGLKINTNRPYPIYRKSGVIPNYTGHLPKEMFEIGSTYGSTTKRLSVCKYSTVN